MGAEAEALKADIEYRRENMSGTIDAIGDRVVPGRVVARKREAAGSWMRGVRERVMGSASSTTGHVSDRVGGGVSSAAETVTQAPRQVASATGDATRGSPLLAGAIAFGAGALVAALLPETEVEHHVAEQVQPQMGAAASAAQDVGKHAMETAKSSAQEAAHDVQETATDHAHQAADEVRSQTR